MFSNLCKEAKKLMLFQGIFALGNGMSALFVNIYLWKLNSSFTAIAIYNLCIYAALLIFSPLAGKLMQYKSVTTCLRVGIILYTLFYSLILLIGEQAKNYLPHLGVLFGMAMTFYALGINMMTSHVTDNENRDFFLGFIGSVLGITTIVVPPVSGWLIMIFPEYLGYRLIFTITLGLFIFSVLVTFFMKKENRKENFNFVEMIRSFSHSERWRHMMWATVLFGVREGTFTFVVNILLFVALKSEFSLGNYTMIMSAVTLASSYIIGRMLSKEKRAVYFLQGSIMLIIASFILVIWTNPIGVMIFGILDALCKPFWNIPFNSISFEIIDDLKKERGSKLQYIIGREFPLGLGRIAGIAIFLILQNQLQNELVLKILLPSLSVVYLGVFVILNIIQNIQQNKKIYL